VELHNGPIRGRKEGTRKDPRDNHFGDLRVRQEIGGRRRGRVDEPDGHGGTLAVLADE
jgi:hypothetical protein